MAAPARYEAFRNSTFWSAYEARPRTVRERADKNYALLKSKPQHPSLHFKKVGDFWSLRAGLRYRTLATEVDGELIWFWIGSRADYDKLIA